MKARASATVSTSVTAPGGKLAHRADHLGMAGVADQHDLAPLAVEDLGLAVDLGDQRAGGVEVEEVPRPRRLRHRLGTPCAEKITGCVGVRDLVELLDEDRALRLQALDDVAVVDDLVAHIDRRAEPLERQLDDLDGAVDAGAEAARRAQQDVERRLEGSGIGEIWSGARR